MVGDEDDEDDEDGGKRRRNKDKSSGENKRKRLRKARDEHGIEAADDEDLELIREAQGVRCGTVRHGTYRILLKRIGLEAYPKGGFGTLLSGRQSNPVLSLDMCTGIMALN